MMSTKTENLFLLKGKVSLVTGSARGLGRSMAQALAEVGADLMLVDVLGDRLEKTADKISSETGRKVSYFAADLGDINVIDKITVACISEFGQLDILVNNAAMTVRKPFLEITPDEFDRILAVNTRSAYFLSQQVARVMIRQGNGGKIINMASLTSEIGMRNITAYGASKGGVYALTKGLAVELAEYNICVNAIAPGFFETDLTAPVWRNEEKRAWVRSRIPFERPGTPDDIAGTVVYLASAASNYVTGRVIFLDGGWMAS
jgi:NAD(P)-dependent dehydrogenase (short-subunit alcohol dehydrogenase family)